MTAALITLTEFKRFVPNTPSGDDTLLQELLDEGEDLLNRQAGRRLRPFAAAQTARSETRDGTGSCELYLHYAISALTSVKIGRDSSDPDEELDVADVDVLVYATGERRLYRTDGGLFGYTNDPRMVHVVYNAAADLPDSAQLALKSVVATVYRQRGSEDASRESLAGYSHDLRRAAEEDPLWQAAIADQWSPYT